MSLERLKSMKESLMNCVDGQICGHLQEVDAKELGEAVDMVKDLSEAIYYCTITEAMEKDEKEMKDGEKMYMRGNYNRDMYMYPRYTYPMEYYDPVMYRRGVEGSGNGRGNSGNSNSYNYRAGGNNSGSSNNSSGNSGSSSYTMYHDGYIGPTQTEFMRDEYAGRSPMHRKMYMEGKHTHKDKNKQMQELEKYMQELANDMTEMIADASPEEKAMLQQKIATLAQKVK